MMRHLLLPLVLLSAVNCKDADIDNMINHGEDDAVLRAMKNGGVVDDMEKQLGKEAYLSAQEKSMLVSFIEEYKSDNNKDVNNENVMKIVDRVVQNKKPNLPQLLVQLGPVIDVLSQLEKKSKSINIILAQQDQVIDYTQSTKEVFATLTKNLKREILKQQIHSHPEPPKSNSNSGILETFMQEVLKNKNPMELMSLMNGDMSMLSNILGSMDLISILQRMMETYFATSPYGPIVKQYMTMFLESEQGKSMIENLKLFMGTIAESNSGQRILKLAPQLMAVKDVQSLMEILGKEVEYNWRLFFNQILNSSYKQEFIQKVSGAAVRSYEYVKNPPANSPLNQLPLIMNGFLMTYKLPAFDVNAPAKSISALLNKSIKMFTTKKFDTAPFIETAYSTITEALSKHLKEPEFSKKSTDMKIEMVSAVMEIEIIQPTLKVWQVYSQAADQPECSAKFLCEINRLEKLAPQKRIGVVKAASYAASWTLSKASQEKYWKFYHAVNAGSMGADCEASYPNKNCVLGKLGVSHNEL